MKTVEEKIIKILKTNNCPLEESKFKKDLVGVGVDRVDLLEIWDKAQKDLLSNDGYLYVLNAIVNRIRYLESKINNEVTYIRIASRKELEFFKKLHKDFDLKFSFQKIEIEE